MNKSVKPVLKQRWITAAALVPAAIVVVLLPTWLFAGAIAGVVLLASKEWLQLRPISEDVIRRNMLLAAAGLFVLYWIAHVDTVVVVSMLIAAGSWFMRALRLVNAPRSPESEAKTHEDEGAYNQTKAHIESHAEVLASAALNGRQHLLKGAALLAFPFLALVALHADADFGPPYVLYLLSLVWVADSAAFFGGRRWGAHRLAPEISPGKTWEGVFVALGAAAVWAVAGAAWLDLRGAAIFYFFILSIVVVAFSIVGDLNESLEKRAAHVKDSGHLLPGHGGVLDRIDSTTAAAPIFTLGVWWMG